MYKHSLNVNYLQILFSHTRAEDQCARTSILCFAISLLVILFSHVTTEYRLQFRLHTVRSDLHAKVAVVNKASLREVGGGGGRL